MGVTFVYEILKSEKSDGAGADKKVKEDALVDKKEDAGADKKDEKKAPEKEVKKQKSGKDAIFMKSAFGAVALGLISYI